jgi:long-chain acyl-CoA synthetase
MTTLATLALDAAERHAGPAVRFKAGDRWEAVSYPDMGAIARAIAQGLIATGIAPGDRVAILSNTRPEWTYADLGILCAGAVVVPVYQTNAPEECRYVLEHSGARLVFCEDAGQLDKIDQIRGDLPALEHVVAFEDAREGASSLDELRALGAGLDRDAVRERVAAVGRDDLATIVYTSGTTGPPKGCMLTHGNLASDVEMCRERVAFEGENVFYIFLPLAHVLTRLVQFLAIDVGAEVAYWQRDPKRLVQEVGEVRPTHLPSVPRLFEKIHTTATARVAEAGGVKARMFGWATGVGKRVHERQSAGRPVGPLLRAQHALADRLVLHRVRELFGGRVKMCLTGAAPIDTEILAFFFGAGVPVLEGYGMTETSAVATLNTVEEHKLGTVGRPIPGCEVRIGEGGEVLMRGPNIFPGYYRDEEATRAALIDGWLHSGDLGELDEDGYLTITGRKKDLIITSSGKNITPSNVENAIRQSRWISQAVVFGDRKPYLTAIVTLDAEEAPALAQEVGADGADLEALAGDERVRAEVQRAIDAANQRFARIEQVKRFSILPRDLSQDEDELTPTLKIKRNVVYDRHADRFAQLYEQ